MRGKVNLIISDKLFARATAIMLKNAGFEIEADTDDTECPCITDNVERTGKRVLFLSGKELPKGKKNVLTGPFTESELIAAVDELFANRKTANTKSDELIADKDKRVAVYKGQSVDLTDREFELLALLLENKGRAVSDSQIVERVWKNETDAGSNIAAVYINYLRKKLDDRFGQRLIVRVRSEGYMLKL